jgi:hypothetical protein
MVMSDSDRRAFEAFPRLYHTTGTVGIGFSVFDPYGSGLMQDMSESQRRDFLAYVREAVTNVGGEVLFSGQGLGVWEGVSEPSGTVVFRLRIDSSVSERKATLCTLLARLASQYSQDAIALTFGDCQLIESA